MKIYLDVVMIINFFFDFLLLLTVSLLLKRRISIMRIIYGAFIGGLSIILLFFKMNNLELFFYKFIISILMILITFGYRNIKYTIINLIYLYIISIFLGGALYFVNNSFSYKHQGVIFYHNGLSINIVLIILITPVLLFIYLKQLHKIKNNYNNYYPVKIILNKQLIEGVGYLDSGNNLIDSLTNKKIIFIDKRKIIFAINEFRFIPLHTVSGNDLVKCIKIDKVIIHNHEYKDVLLGIIDNIHLDGIDIILNNKMEGIC